MKYHIRAIVIFIFTILILAQDMHGAEVRSYITKSRMIIESGSAYKIAPALYTELEIDSNTIIKRTYAIRKDGVFLVSENSFNILMPSTENVSDTRPRWLRKIMKFFGRDHSTNAEDVMRAINIDEMSRGMGRSYVMLTVGRSFLIEIDSQCAHPALNYPNITDYRYYQATARRPTFGPLRVNTSEY